MTEKKEIVYMTVFIYFLRLTEFYNELLST